MLTLSDYQIIEQIYESLNSVVCRCIRNKDNQSVILKMLKEDYSTHAELARYRQEYEIIHNSDLAGVIRAYSIEKYQNTLVIVLEDFGAESLKKLTADCPLTIKEFLPSAIQIADSLGNIHAANIIHKDINPSNIVANPNTGQLKIIDFGIASRLPRENPALKNPEQLEGTLAYLSPEQTGRISRNTDYRTDLYSLGVTFYELLTGQLPFTAADPMELVHCHIAKTPCPVCEVSPDIPPILSDIVMKLLAKNAEDRYQSAFGVKADLEKCQENLRGFKNLGGLAFELAQNDFSGKLQIPQKLYGRDNEVGTLLQAFKRVSEGAAEMMLVAGYSGVGKTALVHEVHKPMTEKHGYFAAGKFDQFQKNIPYYAITQAFNKFCRYLLMENAETLANWQTKILDAVGHNGQIVIDVIPDLELVIGRQPAVAEVGPTEAQNRFQMFFLNFVKALCDKDHPFTLFVDDLQWVDSASLGLLKNIMLDDEIRHLLIIGAYRDNEVDGSHPFIMAADELRKADAVINTIELTNLQPADISHLLQDSLLCESSQTQALTDLTEQKTRGNAFFTHQFLQTLYEEGLLRFDSEHHQWRWDAEQIAAQNITANVVELMADKIDKLPEKTSAALQLAACIGNQFDLPVLAVIYEQNKNETLSALRPALAEGLVQPLDENCKHPDTAEKSQFRFLHDRVQQAAYALIDDEQKKAVHLQTGRLLLKNTPAEALEEKVFDIVEHFNHSLELLNNQLEELEIAQLNLMAGQKAKMATAYGAALNYLTVGRKCLTEKSWESAYDLTLSLFTEAAEAAYLSGDFGETEQLAQTVSQHARTLSDEAKICEISILAYVAQNQQQKAIKSALIFLNRLGIRLPEEPTQEDIGLASQEMQVSLSDKPIRSLIELPIMTNTHKILAARVMMAVSPAAFQMSPGLMILLVLKQVDLSLEYGNGSESAFSYVCYGFILCGVVGDIESGYQFGQLGLDLLKRLGEKGPDARVVHMFNGHVRLWKEHVRETLQPLFGNYQTALETGDIEYAAYSVHLYLYYSYFSGKQLAILEQEMARYSQTVARLKQEGILNRNNLLWQVVFNLMGHSGNPCRLTGKVYDENVQLSLYLQTNDEISLHFLHLNISILHYLFQEYVQAVENAEIAEQHLAGLTSSLLEAMFYFYDSLARLAVYPSLPPQEQDAVLSKVSANQQKMRSWAEHAPMNYQHKYDMVEAEKARVSGQIIEAESLYEQAIRGAADNGYIQEEALAYELAAKFYLGRNLEKFAKLCLQESLHCYQQWGARAKIADLQAKYPQLLTATQKAKSFDPGVTIKATPVNSSTAQLTTTHLDLSSVMKASQTLSGEIVLSKLLADMMHIVIENAGAERGLLLLPQQDNWFVEAEGRVGSDEVTVLQSLAIEENEQVPANLIHYVARTQENVVLSDAAQKGNFTRDAYIVRQRPKSVLGMPLVNQGKLTGILYLENNLAEGAFTPQRLEVLTLLSSQLAISIENSLLYNNLEQKVAERTEELQQEIVERQRAEEAAKVASKAKSEFLANMSHEIRTPMNAILGFAEILKGRIEEPELSHHLESIHTSGRSLLSLINDILDLSKVEASKLRLEYTAVSPQRLFNEMRTVFGQKIKEKGLDLIIDISPELPKTLLLDETRLRQILINLIGNAVKFTDTGHIRLSVSYRYPEDTQHSTLDFIFSVEDTGAGIPDDQCESVFEAFSQAKGQKFSKFGGTGLGLAITRRLIEMMDGEITVSSEVGRGTVFNIIIKEVEVASADDLTASQEKETDFDSIVFEQGTILIADDIAYNRELLTVFFEGYDLTLLEAENGREAIEKAREHQPDLILLDMKMPEMDGYEAALVLKKDDDLKEIPVIAVTASAMRKDDEIIKDLCDSYLRKPVSRADLISEVSKFLPHTVTKKKSVVSEAARKEAAEGPMIPPPPEEMKILYDIVMDGNMREIREYAAHLEQSDKTYVPFARKLCELARNFQDEQILTLVEQYMEEKK